MLENYPQFFTATILEWKTLLKPDKYKNVIIDSLQFLVDNKRIKVYAFVIMPNHIHLIWQIAPGNKREIVQRDLLRYTGQRLKEDLVQYHPKVLEQFKVQAKDRKYQFWERNALSIDLYDEKILLQKWSTCTIIHYRKSGSYVRYRKNILILLLHFIILE